MSSRFYVRRFGSQGSTEGVKWLLITIIGVFILQNISLVWFKSPFLEKAFALSTANVKSGYIWTFITYAFLHANFIHILVNSLVIFFIGRILEPIIGTKTFLKLFIFAAFTGGVAWFLLKTSPNSLLIGASAGAFGLMTYFCLSFPERLITVLLFFVIPVVLKPKWLLWGLLAIEGFLFLFYELPGKTVVASSAHLGGMLGGFILYFLNSRNIHPFKKVSTKIEPPSWLKKKIIHKSDKKSFKVNIKEREELKQEVDRILDKINHKGFGSLTNEEKKTLDKARDLL